MDALYTGKQIAERRKSLGLTQKMLAAQLNVTDKAVSKWERGLNFPDLGLMEELAKVLQTTPAVLLGLEDADQQEVVKSLTQLSSEQLEDAHKDIRQAGWISIGSAVLLVISYTMFGSNVRKTQIAYQLLHGVIMLALIGGIWMLFKYGEIRKWNSGDWLIFYGAVFPVALWNGIYFITGYSPNNYLTMVLVAIGAALAQLLFCRIMRPKVMKALPLLLSIAYMVWILWLRYSPLDAAIAVACCLIVWLICRLRN